MKVAKRFWNWAGDKRQAIWDRRDQQAGQTCSTCRYMGDFFDPAEDNPDEANDYCEHPDQPEQSPYGGHWVHRDSPACERWMAQPGKETA